MESTQTLSLLALMLPQDIDIGVIVSPSTVQTISRLNYRNSTRIAKRNSLPLTIFRDIPFFLLESPIAIYIRKRNQRKKTSLSLTRYYRKVETIKDPIMIYRCTIGNLQGKVQWSTDGFAMGYELDTIRSYCPKCSPKGNKLRGTCSGLLINNWYDLLLPSSLIDYCQVLVPKSPFPKSRGLGWN